MMGEFTCLQCWAWPGASDCEVSHTNSFFIEFLRLQDPAGFPLRMPWYFIPRKLSWGTNRSLTAMHRTSFAAVATASAIAFTQIASAADLPRKAPAYTPFFSWTGCYIGGNIGYGWGRETVSISNLGETTGVPELAGVSLGPVTGNTNGVLGGGQAGCNYQFAPQLGDRHRRRRRSSQHQGRRESIFLVCEPDRSHNSHRNGACPDKLDCQRHRSPRFYVGSRDALCQGRRDMGG